jgi:RecA-family ATPase
MTSAELLNHIDPSTLDYQEWVNVGMALHHEGATAEEWDAWSQRDTKRYKPGDCARKWSSFHGSSKPVTGGTLVELAKRSGWKPERRQTGPGRALDWGDTIGGDDYQVVDTAWVEDSEVHAIENTPDWRQLQMYLEALFEASDHVGYVCEAWQQDERWLPKKGIWTRTAGELIAELSKYKDIGEAMGDHNPDVGAWIRFNPLDGQGIKDANVTGFRYALIESDTLSVEKQASVYAELELPIAALVHSGGKSLHAIVRIGATSKEEYRERVNFLHKVCESNGLAIDTQNKNPSRLSRMPGVTRNGQQQALVGLSQGKASFEEWREWIEELNDSLPDIECLADIWEDLPPLAPPLIDGVLRMGHKMLLAGPSKAGKSYLLLQLAMAIAEGREWLNWQCTQGKVLYVNLELDRPSCLHRLKSLYHAKRWEPANRGSIDIWNLRGKALPLDKLAPKLIRRVKSSNLSAVIIDPTYKVITGDENAADKMAFFCNQFDRICDELGASVIYCHHHSKGNQGQKASRDRSSGSGVFARDPDAIIDIIELNLEQSHKAVLDNRYVCPVVSRFMDEHKSGWQSAIGQDDAIVAAKFIEAARAMLDDKHKKDLQQRIDEARYHILKFSGWRLEGTLREFAPFDACNMLFTYPIHVADTDQILASAKADGEETPAETAMRKKREAGHTKQSQREELIAAHEDLDDGSGVMVGDMADAIGVTVRTLKGRIAKTKMLVVDDAGVVRNKQQAEQHVIDEAVSAAKDLHGAVSLLAVAEALELSEQGARKKIQRDGRYAIKDRHVVPKED